MANKSLFGKLNNGEEVFRFSLRNNNGTEINLINYGAAVTSIFFRNRKGVIEDIVLGYDSLEGYVNDKAFIGAIVGRYCNRIAEGKFILKDKIYQLTINDGKNHLHGGGKGFYKKFWNLEEESDQSVTFSYKSPDGEEGYPGNVKIKVTYSLTEDDELRINYEGITDKTTIFNPAHHSYFNLSGDFTKNILDHILYINAEKFLPVNSVQIPTGNIEKVLNTPFNFLTPVPIGKHINNKHVQLEYGRGYDHNWVLNDFDKSVRLAASVHHPSSGRFLEVFTDQPGLQFYSGNFLDGTITGKKGIKYNCRSAFCLETQHFPDSPNHPEFPSTVLNPGDVYKQEAVYRFSIKN